LHSVLAVTLFTKNSMYHLGALNSLLTRGRDGGAGSKALTSPFLLVTSLAKQFCYLHTFMSIHSMSTI